MRLVLLFNLVQRTEPGLAQSAAKSPFPSPTPAISLLISATSVLPRRFQAWIHVPGSVLDLPDLFSFFHSL
jgi:hypothetical protein